MNKQETKSAADPSSDEDMSAIGRDSLQMAMRSYSEWLQTASKVQTETLRFISDRIRKDMEMPAKFAACKNPADVLNEQMEFANTMAFDYAEEGHKFVRILSDAAEDLQVRVTPSPDE